MTTLVVSLLSGGLIGAASTALVYEWRRRATPRYAEQLTEEDRDVITAQFAAHSADMRQQVAHFADTLAGDDLVLRERLRTFEPGETS